jgi:hypothetical protein
MGEENQEFVDAKENLKTPEEKREDKENSDRKEKKQLADRIVKGQNDIFEKEYTFEDLDMKFTIKLRAPNAIEVGKIQAKTSIYLGGTNQYASHFHLMAFNALATIRTVGVSVPEELKKDEDIYNLNVLYKIGVDFAEWLNKFRF